MIISANSHTINPILFVRRLEEATVEYPNADKLDLHLPRDREKCMCECLLLLVENPGHAIRGSDKMGRNFYCEVDGGVPAVIISSEDGYTRLHVEH